MGMGQVCDCSLSDGRPHPHPTKVWKIRLYRDNRWDVYPQRQPIEEVIVTARSRQFLADAVGEQHPKWRVAGFIFSSIEETGLAPCRMHGARTADGGNASA
jgi:hypothetical protein